MNKLTQQDIDKEMERTAALRMQMLEMHPFWGYILLQMRLVPAPELPAMAMTDGLRHIWINPRRTRDLSLRELGFVLAHEVCHAVFASSARQCGREAFKWNQATDYAINAIVADIPLPGNSLYFHPLYQMPQGVLYNQKYKNWIAEVIYEDLCRKDQNKKPQQYALFLPDADGKMRELPDVMDHDGGIDIHLPLLEDAAFREAVQQKVQTALEYYRVNNARGDLPENLLREAGMLDPPPKLPWKRLLHRYADTAIAGDDYSLAHPNRRYLMHDLVVPGKYSEKMASVVVALDTSASMSDDTIREIAGEIRGILPDARQITLIVADAAIQQVVPFENIENYLNRGKFPGGGGTDHVCVFRYIEEHKLNPSLFIGLSDLASRFPLKQPPYPVLWIVPELHDDPPWGKVIEL